MHTYGQLGQHDPSGGLSQLSPETIYRWLGARFAVLEAPRYRSRTVGQSWEGVGRSGQTVGQSWDGISRRWEPTGDHGDIRNAEVRLVHELTSGATIDVATARDDIGGASMVDRLREGLINYQLALVGRQGSLPWGEGPPPPDYFERLEAAVPREPTGTRAMTVDGETTAGWVNLAFSDVITGTVLAACGARFGASLVMVIGPEAAIVAAQLGMWPPRSDLFPGV